MESPDTHHSFLYRHEVLRSKLKIRDHYFKTIVRGIYENTGQILSLVQIQLAIVETQIKDDIKLNIAKSRNLVGRAIYDLRDMSKSFCPEDEILSESGLIDALKRELENYTGDNAMSKIRVRGIPFALSSEGGLVFFLVILEIVGVIVESYGAESLELAVVYSDTKLSISMSYSGSPIDLDVLEPFHFEPSAAGSLGVYDRLNLIGGNIIIKARRNKRSRVDVSMPYQSCNAA